MHPVPHAAAPSEAIVLIVSPDAGECERLRRCLPPGVAVRLAATEDEAVGLLRATTGAPDLIHPGVGLLPDGVLVAGAEVRLTPLEHAMLACLCSPVGSVWSLRTLSEQVWGTSFVGNGSQVRAVLKRLRRKLLVAGADLRIESVRGWGLRLVVGSHAGQDTVPPLPHNCPSQPVAEHG